MPSPHSPVISTKCKARGSSGDLAKAGIDEDITVTQTVNFNAHGPFRLQRKGSPGARILVAERARALWSESAELRRLATARGCYVFATRHQGGGLIPWYVGMTARSFEQECFNPANLGRLNDGLFELTGQLVLMLIEYAGTERGTVMVTAAVALENQLIGLAHQRNQRLLNVHGKRIPRVLVIRGAMNSTTRPSAAAKALKSALAL